MESDGLLLPAPDATVLRQTHRYPVDADIRVRPRGDALFGEQCDGGEPFSIPLDPLDVERAAFSSRALADVLRKRNAIDGRAVKPAHGLLPLGRKTLSADVVATVWLAVGLSGGEALAARLSLLTTEGAHSTQVVVLPVWPDLPAATITALAGAGVHVADIAADTLAIRWPDALTDDTTPGVPEYGLLWESASWRLHFLGEEFTISDRIGVLYLARLLDDPSLVWSPQELQRGEQSNEKTRPAAPRSELREVEEIESAMPATDREALQQYKDRVAFLTPRLAAAKAGGRKAEAKKISEEIDTLDDEIRSVEGLGNRVRNSGTDERARKAVSKALTEAFAEIAKRNAAIAKRLDGRTHRGWDLTYTPERGEVWQVRFPAGK